MMQKKWLTTTAIFDEYERRFALARAAKPLTHPWEPEQQETILRSLKRMIRYDEAFIPTIHNIEEISTTTYDGYTATELRYQTWEQMYGCSTLFLPNADGKLPLVFLCCGHGVEGRLSPGYRGMAHRLAQLGMAVLVMDNIGQGNRNPNPTKANDVDHWFAEAPFQCGLTLQGMIVMETIAMIRYMRNDPRFDADRFGACGNSGGGALTMYLSALAPELSAIASSGFPSDFPYILQKERRHCACNILIGQAYEVDMWEIFSMFAPKPLLLEGGMLDNLLPMDTAHRNARKVRNTYVQFGAEENFHFQLTSTKHSWELDDHNLISRFLSQHLLNVIPEDGTAIFPAEDPALFTIPIPKDCLTTAQLSEKISGKPVPEGKCLQDLFVPTFQGKPIDPEQLQPDVGRGDVMRVFAQMECALYHPE